MTKTNDINCLMGNFQVKEQDLLKLSKKNYKKFYKSITVCVLALLIIGLSLFKMNDLPQKMTQQQTQLVNQLVNQSRNPAQVKRIAHKYHFYTQPLILNDSFVSLINHSVKQSKQSKIIKQFINWQHNYIHYIFVHILFVAIGILLLLIGVLIYNPRKMLEMLLKIPEVSSQDIIKIAQNSNSLDDNMNTNDNLIDKSQDKIDQEKTQESNKEYNQEQGNQEEDNQEKRNYANKPVKAYWLSASQSRYINKNILNKKNKLLVLNDGSLINIFDVETYNEWNELLEKLNIKTYHELNTLKLY